MKGHIRARGPGAWELKFDVQSETGERKTKYVTFRGGKREAQRKLTELLDQANKSSFIEPSKETLGEYLDRWERDWVASNVSRRRFVGSGRDRQTVRWQIGGKPVLVPVSFATVMAVSS